MDESELQRLLFMNEAFYAAFSARDAGALEDLLAKDEPVWCLHPGWPLLRGRRQVMASWRSILGNEHSPPVVCVGAQAEIKDGLGLVCCYEKLEGAVLVATNLFRQEGGIWRLFHHQAGPCQDPPEEILAESPVVALQ